MIEFSRFEDLHIVRKIREKIRGWWKIELSYADERGYVLDHAKGKIVPPHNPICEASLGSPPGFRSCNASVEAAIRSLRDSPEVRRGEVRAVVVETCHLGFPIVVAPVIDDEGTFHGAIFAGGFLVQDELMSRRRSLLEGIEREDLSVGSRSEAVDAVPTISRRDLAYFRDLLETTVGEIVAFNKALRQRDQRIEALTGELSGRYDFSRIIGRSEAMRQLLAVLSKVVGSESTVLVTGENGTGKELIAKALHYSGPRKERPFVVQNCSAFNDNLLESELFGHVRGAFTGASRDKPGLFRAADTGTFFLDEVGDMSANMQVKLLRVLQEGTFLPVGSTSPEQVDVHIIAATHRDLRKMVAEGSFREDLFYRLNVINLEVPPLRDRRDDIPLLVEHFLERHAERSREPLKRAGPGVLSALFSHDWPGNIRELENEIERMVVLAGGEEDLSAEHLSFASRPAPERPRFERFHGDGDLASAVSALEAEMIREGLVATHWNKTRLARRLGVSRTTLIKKIKEYGLEASPPSAAGVD